MAKVLPSILSADFANLERDIKELEDLGIDSFHIDVMDGNFVPNISFGFPVIDSIRKISKSVFDIHLMIANPENYVEQFCESGADMVSFHIEATNHADRIIQLIKSKGKKAGIVLNPQTPIESIKYILDKVDYVLIMTVNPGFGGQKFIESMINKISELSSLRKEYGYEFLIEVDGGINIETADLCKKAGVDLLVCGSFLFSADDKKHTIAELEK